MLEYMCMPLGELSDFIDFYAASEGTVQVLPARKGKNTNYIPEVR